MTPDQMRELALSMPEAEERSHFGKPDFRVGGKIFAGVSAEGDRANLKLTPELQAAAIDANPGAFTPCEGAWGRSGWTYANLADVGVAEMRELVREAWRLVAPRKLVTAQAATKAKVKPAGRR